jgi:hypothetical protein
MMKMRTFRVLLPAGGAEPMLAAERARFVREGFSWPALLFGPFWLLARGLWRPLGAWCLGAIFVVLMFRGGKLGSGAGGWLYLLSAVYLGLEGRKFVAAAIERRGFAFVDVVLGPNRSVAEEIFFNRWPVKNEAPPSAAPRANIPVAPSAPSHVIGMFPEGGG